MKNSAEFVIIRVVLFS